MLPKATNGRIQGKAGWALTSQADLLLVYVQGLDLIYIWSFEELRKHLFDWARTFTIKPAENRDYRTWGLCVDLCEFEQGAEHVINLSDYLGISKK